ncbi:MAG: DUF1840 domain-containing protein [Gammaproteobacteria bacterium]
MPITFKSKHAPNIVMLEAVALELLHLMGHSGTVPGSLAADDIPAALARLEGAVNAAPARALEADRGDDDDDRAGEGVSAAHRALPLIEMLRSAEAEGDYVIWDR